MESAKNITIKPAGRFKYERKKLAALISEMLTAKDEKVKKDEIRIVNKMSTLDILSLQTAKDILKEQGCECMGN